MAYTLIPEGFTLKKVTKAEKDAVDEYFGRERRGTYLEELLGNPNTPLVFGAGALAVSLPLLISLLLQMLEDALNITLTDKQKADLFTHAQLKLGPIGIAQVLGRKVGTGLVDFVEGFEFPRDLKGFGGKGLA